MTTDARRVEDGAVLSIEIAGELIEKRATYGLHLCVLCHVM